MRSLGFRWLLPVVCGIVSTAGWLVACGGGGEGGSIGAAGTTNAGAGGIGGGGAGGSGGFGAIAGKGGSAANAGTGGGAGSAAASGSGGMIDAGDGSAGADAGQCDDGSTQSCYSGPPGTDGVGVCSAGTLSCNSGLWSTCQGETVPSSEICNGLDDDCDGLADEDSGQTTCGLGICKVTVDDCVNGQPQQCVPNPGNPTEKCDGVDDNCDGQVDEGCVCIDGQTQSCYGGDPLTKNVGECVGGTQTCAGGTWGTTCVGEVLPTSEKCNGLDDDCDGKIDEGNPDSGQTCDTKKPGVCAAGTTTCQASVLVCSELVQPSTEVCDGLDNNCNGVVDDGNPEGGQVCNTSKPGICAPGTTTCQNGAVACVQNAQPGSETCNGLDDDCDALTDESNPGGGQACSTGKPGVCSVGTTSCENGSIVCNQNTGAGAEVCNGLDDDCDGTVDQGNPGGGQACSTGKLGVCAAGTTACTAGKIVCNQNTQAGTEKCNGLDDDCDGLTDENNPGGGTPCSTGQPGVCATGVTSCSAGQIICTPTTAPSAEKCDGLDNDCDGQTDEGSPGGGVACNTGKLGVCAAGITSCTSGKILCNQTTQSSVEKCNGLDDDCDGLTDENNPGGGALCSTGQPGVCASGTTACTGGQLVCNPTTAPSSEICDGLDNDCDAQTDEGNPGGGLACTTGKPGVCSAGTTACSSGAIVCNQNNQPSTEICDGLDNNCNGATDENNPGGGAGCSTGKPGICAAGTTTCVGGALTCVQNQQPVPEICGNTTDDDCDGQTNEGCCAPGTADCDGQSSNGCEVNITNSPLNCSACGVKCGSDATCACVSSACSGGTIYFSEDFSDNSKGWTLGTEWQIGSATASSGQNALGPDPATDHSATTDNGVAGVVIGGNASTAQHAAYYLTSPAVNLSTAAGTVNLTFWRWLNSDYTPYMLNTIEVYNGSTWTVIWQTAGTATNDTAWTLQTFNVTTYKNAAFRVRFGFSIGSTGVWTVSSWNIDDVTLASGTCQ